MQPGDMESMFSSIESRFGKKYGIEVISRSPWVVTLENFLSDRLGRHSYRFFCSRGLTRPCFQRGCCPDQHGEEVGAVHGYGADERVRRDRSHPLQRPHLQQQVRLHHSEWSCTTPVVCVLHQVHVRMTKVLLLLHPSLPKYQL